MLNGLALFAGVARLELAAALVLGRSYRTVCYVERDAYAAAVMAARMEDKVLDKASIWDDVTSFDCGPWRGLVDFIIGGFPCQDISNAGSRKGILGGDRSGLWFSFERIIREVGPRYVFVENVAALARRGLDIVLGSLAELGFDAEWLTIPASHVGAPHGRKRIFILAYAKDSNGRGRVPGFPRAAWSGGRGPGGSGPELADATSGGLGELREPYKPEQSSGGQPDGGDAQVAEVRGLPRSPARGEEQSILEEDGGIRKEARNRSEGERELAHPDSLGHVGSEGGRREAEHGPQHAREELADTNDRTGQQALRHEELPELTGRGDAELADPDDGAGGGQPRIEREERSEVPWRSMPEFPDAKRAGLQGDRPAGPYRRGKSLSLRGDRPEIPLFPPHAKAFGEWSEILAHSPHLSPSVKPRLRIMVDGMAVVVDKSRTDQLRCSGNGVVDLQAAVALSVLDERLGTGLRNREER